MEIKGIPPDDITGRHLERLVDYKTALLTYLESRGDKRFENNFYEDCSFDKIIEHYFLRGYKVPKRAKEIWK